MSIFNIIAEFDTWTKLQGLEQAIVFTLPIVLF